jgi:hypothetical protein
MQILTQQRGERRVLPGGERGSPLPRPRPESSATRPAGALAPGSGGAAPEWCQPSCRSRSGIVSAPGCSPPRRRRPDVSRGHHIEQFNDPLNPELSHSPFGTFSACLASGYTTPEWTLPDPDGHGTPPLWTGIGPPRTAGLVAPVLGRSTVASDQAEGAGSVACAGSGRERVMAVPYARVDHCVGHDGASLTALRRSWMTSGGSVSTTPTPLPATKGGAHRGAARASGSATTSGCLFTSRPRRSHVSTTVSGFSDMESIASASNHSARSGWSEGP